MDRLALVLSASAARGAPRSRAAVPALGAALVAVAALAALVAVVASPHAALVAKALADPFFHSTSAGAAIALLAFAAAGALVRAAWPQAPSTALQRVAAVALLGAIVAGNAANLAGHVLHMAALGLPPTAAAYHWSGDANTYSYLLHSHEGKAVLGALLGPLVRDAAPALDVGQGLGAAPPGAISLACAVALALAVGASLVLLRAFAASGRAVALAALFAFCALNATKTIVDGGPLTYRFAPALVTLALLLAPLAAPSRAWRRVVVACAVSIASGCLAAWAWLGSTESRDAALGFATTLAVIVALSAAAWRAAPGTRARLRRAGLWAGSAIVLAALGASMLGVAIGPNLPLDADARATVCDPVTLACSEHAVAGRTLVQVYLDAGEDPTKPRRTFVWRPRERGATRLALAIVAPVRVPSSGAGTVAPVTLELAGRLPGGAGELVVAASDALPAIFGAAPTPTSANNYHVYLHTVAARLRALGVGRFTMVPVRDRADALALGLVAPGAR